jgi:hypothetical protein
MIKNISVKDQKERIKELEKLSYKTELDKIYKKEIKLINTYGQECFVRNEIKTNKKIEEIPKNSIDKIDYENAKEIKFLNYNDFSEKLQNEYFSNNVMNTTTCIILNMLKNKNIITNLLQVFFMDTQESDQATIIIFKIKNTDIKFVAKWEISEYLLHESVVSIFISNEMRKVLPTFVWFYGLTSCNLPIVDNKLEIITGCDKQVSVDKISYIGLVSEYIDGINLGTYFKNEDYNDEDVAKIVMIVMCSIYKAFCKFKFVHYDLHLNNVRLRKTNQKYKYIKFQNNFYIELPNNSKYLPTIIDFGLSSFELNNEKYGNFGYLFDPFNQSFFIDSIKFLYSIYNETKNIKKINKLFNSINEILSLLIIDHEKTFLKFMSENSGTVFNTSKLDKSLTAKDFMKIIYNSFEKHDIFVIKNKVDEKFVIPCTKDKDIESNFFTRTNVENVYELESLFNDTKFFVSRKIQDYFNNHFYLNLDNIPIYDNQKNTKKSAITEIIKITNELNNLNIHQQFLDIFERKLNIDYENNSDKEDILKDTNIMKSKIKNRKNKLLDLIFNLSNNQNLKSIENIIKTKDFITNKEYGEFDIYVNNLLKNNLSEILIKNYLDFIR